MAADTMTEEHVVLHQVRRRKTGGHSRCDTARPADNITRHTGLELRERVKELSCLYGIARIVVDTQRTLEEALQAIVELLPPSWLYPDIAVARIVLEGRQFSSAGPETARSRQSADVVARGIRRGAVEVAYSEDRPQRDEGPFLKEERSLIDAVAREISLLLEQKDLEREREEAREQLRRADRLATLGLLSAGIAHEINEPLEGILGFAQLIKSTPGLPESAERDARKIIQSSLHARDIVRKMRLLSLQSSAERSSVNLNRLVEESMFLLENKCNRPGIHLAKKLGQGMPDITADSTQLRQVLVNLVVNAGQAMPDGGKITIATRVGDRTVSLIVEDSGTGIKAESLDHIFDPFFTMKNVNEGTGLGLAIVKRIVSLHGGRINVDSRPGVGSRFEVVLPVDGERAPPEKGQDVVT